MEESGQRKRYHLYIDETGNHVMSTKSYKGWNERYLGLMGVIMQQPYIDRVFEPQLERFKGWFFASDEGSPVILHRNEIVRTRGPFRVLKEDPDLHREYNFSLITHLMSWKFRAIAVVIDKKEHDARYEMPYEPYDYCLTVLIEKYVLFLEASDAEGCITLEARGKKYDRPIKHMYHRLREEGTSFIEAARLVERLPQNDLVFQEKKDNVGGLQLADILAYPARRQILIEQQAISRGNFNFSDRICRVLEESKYHRSEEGKIEGYGKKCLSFSKKEEALAS